MINRYEEIIKSNHKRVVRRYIYIQGEILKMFKETENFENAGQSRSTIYFRIAFYKLVKKSLGSNNQHCHQFTFEII